MLSDGAPRARPDASRAPALLVGAALCVALVVVPEAFLFPFVVTKTAFFRPLAWAAAATLAAAALLRPGTARRPGPVAWAGLAFLASMAVSAAFGVDPARGVWDTGERMTGLVTYAAAAAVFATAVAAGRDAAAWRPLLRWACAVTVPVAALAAFQAAAASGDGTRGRPDATLGSAAFVGAFGVHAVFLGVLTATSGAARADRAFGAAAVAAGLVSVAASEARAALVGLALGAVYLAVRAAVDGTPRTRRRIVGAAVAVAAAGCAVIALRDVPLVRELPLVRRLLAFDAGDATFATRRLAWDVGLDAARDRPLLGWGPNAFAHAFSAHYRPEFLRFERASFDDAHGILPATLAEQGLVGVAALTALYVAAFAALRRGRTSGRVPAAAAAAGGAWLAGHLGNLMLSFEDVSSLVALAFVLAWCERAGAPPAEVAAPRLRAGPLRVVGAAACGVAALAWTWWADGRTALAAARARDAVDAVPASPDAALAALRASLDAPSPQAATNGHVFAWSVHGALPSLFAAGRAADAEALGRAAFDVLVPRADRPPEPDRQLLRAALADVVPSLAEDEGVRATVREELLRTVAAAPRRQDLRFSLAALALRRGRFDEAAEHVLAVVRDDPGGSRGWARLAAVYRRAGRVDDARRIVRQAQERGLSFDAEDRALVAGLE